MVGRRINGDGSGEERQGARKMEMERWFGGESNGESKESERKRKNKGVREGEMKQ